MIRIILDSATQYAHADINLILTIKGIGEYLTSIHNILSSTMSPNIPYMYLSSFSYLPGVSVTRHLMDQSVDWHISRTKLTLNPCQTLLI